MSAASNSSACLRLLISCSGSAFNGSGRGSAPAPDFPFGSISLEYFSRLRADGEVTTGDTLGYVSTPPGQRADGTLVRIPDNFVSPDAYFKTMQAHSDAESEVSCARPCPKYHLFQRWNSRDMAMARYIWQKEAA